MEPQPSARVKVAFPLNHIVLGVAPDAMLRTEDSLNCEGALPVIGKQTVKNMNQPPRDGSLIADQTDPAALDGAAVIGKQSVKTQKRGGHDMTLPASEENSFKARLGRALNAFYLWVFPALAGSVFAAFAASPDRPAAGLLPAFLPMQVAMLLLAPISFWLSWKKGRAPLYIALPLGFSLFVVIGRLVLDAWGMTLMMMPGKVRADLAWTEWPLLLACALVQSLFLWLSRRKF